MYIILEIEDYSSSVSSVPSVIIIMSSSSKGKGKRGRSSTDNAASGSSSVESRPTESSEHHEDQEEEPTGEAHVPLDREDPVDSDEISTDKFQLLLAAINSSRKSMEQQMENFKEDIRSSHEEATEKLAKRVKRSKPLEFKRRGNELQHKFNDEVIEKFEEVEGELAKVPVDTLAKGIKSPVSKAKQNLKEGKQLLEARQKLIRLADRSEFGWDVVKEYEEDELAEGSDDEKRIQRAEKAAEKKAASKKKRVVSAKRFARPYNRQPAPGFVPAWEPQHAHFIHSAAGRGRGVRVIGPCHSCGEFGHLRAGCQKVTSNKYPLSCSDNVTSCIVNELPCSSVNVLPSIRRLSYGTPACSSVDSFPCSKSVKGGSDVELLLCSSVMDISEEDYQWPGVTLSYERCQLDKGVSVKGRLSKNLKYWADTLQAPESILSIIRQGYILPFVSVPESKFFANQKSAHENNMFVTETTQDLLDTGCIRKMHERPIVCSPLLVVVNNSGKKRLVINLRYVNLFLWKEKFKYEDMRTALMLLESGDFLSTFDLKSGYHHVDIHKQSQPFLGFAWNQAYYVFTVLPFGLSTACYVFTKLMRPLIRLWRSKGIKCVVYLDDGIIAANGRSKAQKDSDFVKESLANAGFVVNAEKSHWTPSQRGKWLGFELDLDVGYITVPVAKIVSLKVLLSQAIESNSMSLASIVGRIISMGLGMGPVVRLRSRAMYSLLNSRVSWHDYLIINEDVQQELRFWNDCIEQYNGQRIWRAPSTMRVVYSDASSTGYAGFTVEHGCHIALGQWNAIEAEKSSTWRELTSVARVLEAVSKKLSNSRVKWFTDNQNVVRIICVGSKVSDLQVVALKIFKIVLANNICIEPEWVPCNDNERADALSRIVDYDDWSINPSVFKWLDSIWGPHTVDRFATDFNAQIERFNSRFWCGNTEAVDAFTVNWAGEKEKTIGGALQ